MSFININHLKEHELVSGFNARFVHTDTMTIAYVDILENAILPEHSHPNEQVSNLVEGVFEFTLSGEKKIIRPGEIVVIPSNVPHSGKAITPCKIIDVFSPVREDYKVKFRE